MQHAEDRHPCFNVRAKGSCGRVHLPVAPRCNIMCNYCNRKYDCVSESRPGVTSAVLSPAQAAGYMDEILAREPRITVAGIAGPGDPFANADKTLETISRIRAAHPQMLFCVSSNGLAVPFHLDEIKEAGISHMTITVNAVDPEVGEKFYRWVRDGKVTYQGRAAAELLLGRQREAIAGLKERGVKVKVNTILTPGLNDHHVEDIARVMRELGVDMLNVMALIPTADTPFADRAAPTGKEVDEARGRAQVHLPQMRHCRRCRSDAVGLLDSDRSEEFASCLSKCSEKKDAAGPDASCPNVAVATREGMLVNLHLGETKVFHIYGQNEEGSFAKIDERHAPPPGGGDRRWLTLSDLLRDCRAVLVSGIGPGPRALFEERGPYPVEMEGFIEQGLRAVYGSEDLSKLRKRRETVCGQACSGTGEGC
ncbi:radical SAM protein [Desulfohalovibrio reitneri]|uniref:radical SAM protein n=1 Tax=Desulfohalovibrio reitneri TaxID=1307759 RepID=UPI0004A7605B|nr:radical SAM protein [Desulfohalovibrio reitneri]